MSRITSGYVNRIMTEQLARTNAAYERTLEKLSTLREVNRPSDAPAQAGRAVELRSRISQLDVSEQVISQTRSFMAQGSAALQDVSTMFAEIRSLALAGSDASLAESDRRILAQEADGLLQSLLDLANTQSGDRYVFAGAGTQNPPFEAVVGADGKVQTVRYNGDTNPLSVEVMPGIDVLMAESGQAIFQARDRGETTFTGATGAASGLGADTDVGYRKLEVIATGTTGYSVTGAGAGLSADTYVGDVTLTVIHTETEYEPAATGLRAGTGSANDTIIGEHTLTVDTTAGTISLDGGPAVAIAGDPNQAVTDGVHTVYVDTTGPLSDGVAALRGKGTLNAGGADVEIEFGTDQQVPTADNAALFVDTSGIHGAGVETLTATAALTIDGGATTTPITFAEDQVVTNSYTGAVTRVDTRSIGCTGVEVVEYEGTCDVFETLIYLRNALENGFDQGEAGALAMVQASLTQIDAGHEQVLMALGQVGARVRRLESTENRVSALKLSATEALSLAEDADMSELIVKMQAQENALQAALAATSRLGQLSLLDYWR